MKISKYILPVLAISPMVCVALFFLFCTTPGQLISLGLILFLVTDWGIHRLEEINNEEEK